MKVLSTEHNIPFDVDDTLLIWDYKSVPKADRIKIKDPYTGEFKKYGIHRPHVRLLKQYKKRGYKIIVWSKAGELHAASAAEALGLTTYIDFAMTKPEKVVDDKSDLISIVGPVIYLKP